MAPPRLQTKSALTQKKQTHGISSEERGVQVRYLFSLLFTAQQLDATLYRRIKRRLILDITISMQLVQTPIKRRPSHNLSHAQDKFDRKIAAIIASGTEPSITNIVIRHLVVQEKRIFVIGIGKGFTIPTMITYGDANKFYKRNLSANYGVDVYELNQMFMQHQSVPELAEEFKRVRIKKILDLPPFPNLDISNGIFFTHAIPYSFVKYEMLDLSNIKSEFDTATQPLMVHTKNNRQYHGIESAFNYDGFMRYKVYGNPERIFAYNQYFRNGIIEFFTNEFHTNPIENRTAGTYLLGSPLIKGTIQSIRKAIAVWIYFQIEPPFIIFISIRVPDINGSLAGINGGHIGAFRKSTVDFPGIVFERHEYTEPEIYDVLRRYMDILWQTAGKNACPTAEDFFAPDNLY